MAAMTTALTTTNAAMELALSTRASPQQLLSALLWALVSSFFIAVLVTWFCCKAKDGQDAQAATMQEALTNNEH
jgi:hypothetical protein